MVLLPDGRFGRMLEARERDDMKGDDAVTMTEHSPHSGRGRDGRDEWINVRPTERAITGLVGGLMVGWGLRHGRASGTLAAFFGSMLLGRSISGHCPGYAMMESHGDEEEKRYARERGWSSASTVTRSVTIDKPKQEIYAFYRDFSNLPRFMENVESVEVISPDRSRWTVKGPAGTSLKWVSRVTEDRPDRIAWETEPDADVRNTGWVEFRELPNGRGTLVNAMIAYEPPAGALGKAVATMFGREPGRQASEDLQNLKRLLETGENAIGKMQGGPTGSGASGGGSSGGMAGRGGTGAGGSGAETAAGGMGNVTGGTTGAGPGQPSGDLTGGTSGTPGAGASSKPSGGAAPRAGKPGVTGADVDRA